MMLTVLLLFDDDNANMYARDHGDGNDDSEILLLRGNVLSISCDLIRLVVIKIDCLVFWPDF